MIRHFSMVMAIGTICVSSHLAAAPAWADQSSSTLQPQPTVFTNELRQRMAVLISSMPCSQERWGCKDFAEQLKAMMIQEGLHGSLLQFGFSEKEKKPDSDEYITVFRPIISGIVVRIDGQDIMYDRDSNGTPLDEWYRDIGVESLRRYSSRTTTF